jgi:hypothetical protein
VSLKARDVDVALGALELELARDGRSGGCRGPDGRRGERGRDGAVGVFGGRRVDPLLERFVVNESRIRVVRKYRLILGCGARLPSDL